MRTCSRCGANISSRRVCDACRKPKVVRKETTLGNPLSFREKQVVELIRQAKLNKEIAWELKLTTGTVKEYVNRIFKKVGVTNRVALAVWAETLRKEGANE